MINPSWRHLAAKLSIYVLPTRFDSSLGRVRETGPDVEAGVCAVWRDADGHGEDGADNEEPLGAYLHLPQLPARDLLRRRVGKHKSGARHCRRHLPHCAKSTAGKTDSTMPYVFVIPVTYKYLRMCHLNTYIYV